MGVQVNELRINNWFLFPNSMNGGKLELFQFTKWEEALYLEYGGVPIPLTPEILDRCLTKSETPSIRRFELVYSNKTGYGQWLSLEYDEDEKLYKILDTDFNTLAEVKFVHHLQNLYFALTQTELEIKW